MLPCTYDKAHTGVRSVIYSYIVVEQFTSDLLRQESMDEIIDEHIANYLDTSDAADKIIEKQQSTRAFISRIATFMQCRTSKWVVAEPLARKMKKQLKAHILDADVR